MPRKQTDVEKSLERKGFVKAGGDHHFFHYYTLAGKKSRIFTKTSHGVREIGDGLLARMSKQCKLSRSDFDQLIECPLDQKTYESKLIAAGYVGQQI